MPPAMSCQWLVNFQFFSVHLPRLTKFHFVSDGKKRVDFVDPEMCLLLAMPMGCSKERRYLCSPASLCDLRTAVAPILSPSYLFPHFSVLHELSLCSQTGSTAYFFGSSLTIPQLSPVPSSGKDEPFPFCTHLQAGCNVWQGRIKPAPITGFPAGTGARSPGTSAQAWWYPQGWKTEAGRFSCLLN